LVLSWDIVPDRPNWANWFGPIQTGQFQCLLLAVVSTLYPHLVGHLLVRFSVTNILLKLQQLLLLFCNDIRSLDLGWVSHGLNRPCLVWGFSNNLISNGKVWSACSNPWFMLVCAIGFIGNSTLSCNFRFKPMALQFNLTTNHWWWY
jgi:hypothetical protein